MGNARSLDQDQMLCCSASRLMLAGGTRGGRGLVSILLAGVCCNLGLVAAGSSAVQW